MALKLPPPLLFLLCVFVLYCLPSVFEPVSALRYLAVLVGLVGITIDGLALRAFYRCKTTISPLSPNKTTALATDGVYRISRNPMYLGLVCLLTACSLWLAQPFGILLIWALMAYLTRFQILPEEQVLTEKFGQTYLDYQTEVRRWL